MALAIQKKAVVVMSRILMLTSFLAALGPIVLFPYFKDNGYAYLSVSAVYGLIVGYGRALWLQRSK